MLTSSVVVYFVVFGEYASLARCDLLYRKESVRDNRRADMRGDVRFVRQISADAAFHNFPVGVSSCTNITGNARSLVRIKSEPTNAFITPAVLLK